MPASKASGIPPGYEWCCKTKSGAALTESTPPTVAEESAELPAFRDTPLQTGVATVFGKLDVMSLSQVVVRRMLF